MWSNDSKDDDVTDEDLTKAADLATELTDDELDDAMLGKLFRLHDFRSVNQCLQHRFRLTKKVPTRLDNTVTYAPGVAEGFD